MSIFAINVFGGMNSYDQEDSLMLRSHQLTQNGFQQLAPAESPDMLNMDFDQKGIRNRLGSLEESDLGSFDKNLMASGEELIKGIEWTDPLDGNKVHIIVSTLSMYIRTSIGGTSWSQIQTSTGAAYSHSGVTKCSFASTDGHLFIGLDGINYIQVYSQSSGIRLDQALTTGNTYREAHGSNSTHVITGFSTGTRGSYLLAVMHTRLLFSTGNTVINYTPMAFTSSSGIWDNGGSTAGFYYAEGNIIMMTAFAPHLTDSSQGFFYIGTSNGMQVATGFSASDEIIRIDGSKAPFNHQAWCITNNWLCYLTENKNIIGINGQRIINLGRRLKTVSGDGFLDSFRSSESDARLNAFAFYNEKSEQALFFFTGTASSINNFCAVIDFKLGEPTQQESQDQFETHVRVIPWKLNVNDSVYKNRWFIHVFQTRDKVLGLTTGVDQRDQVSPTGKIYEVGVKHLDTIKRTGVAISSISLTSGSPVSITTSGFHYLTTGDIVYFTGVVGTTELNNNFYRITVSSTTIFTLDDTDGSEYTAYSSAGTIYDCIGIFPYWKSSVLYGESTTRIKQWKKLSLRSVPEGSWLVYVDIYVNKSDEVLKTFSFQQNFYDSLYDSSVFDVTVFDDNGIVRYGERVNLRSESVQYRLYVTNQLEPFTLTNLQQEYYIGAQIN